MSLTIHQDGLPASLDGTLYITSVDVSHGHNRFSEVTIRGHLLTFGVPDRWALREVKNDIGEVVATARLVQPEANDPPAVAEPATASLFEHGWNAEAFMERQEATDSVDSGCDASV